MPNQILIVQFFLTMMVVVSRHSVSLADTSVFTTHGSITSSHTLIPNQGLKVMWWNIDCGYESSAPKLKDNLKTTNLEANLINLSQSKYKPDVLILGEYCPTTMSEHDQNALKNTYQHNYHLARNIPEHRTSSGRVNQRNGFLILSDYPFEILKEEMLLASKDRPDLESDRMYLLFKVIKNKKQFLINPVHLVNPWRDIYKESGKIKTFIEITSGSENKNAVQILNLINKFHENRINNIPYLIIGDFNSPGSIKGFSGWGFKTVRSELTPLLLNHEYTFIGNQVFPSTNLDHAFGYSLTSSYAQVWPLDGARHLPIYVVIDTE